MRGGFSHFLGQSFLRKQEGAGPFPPRIFKLKKVFKKKGRRGGRGGKGEQNFALRFFCDFSEKKTFRTGGG